jgi:hypothetical protein
MIKMTDMVKKIKMLDMVAVKRIKMPEKMEHRQVAGCRTLTFNVVTSSFKDDDPCAFQC